MISSNETKLCQSLLTEYETKLHAFLEDLVDELDDGEEYDDLEELSEAIDSGEVVLDFDQHCEYEHLQSMYVIQSELAEALSVMESGDHHNGKKKLDLVIRHARGVRQDAQERISVANDEIERMNGIIQCCKDAQQKDG